MVIEVASLILTLMSTAPNRALYKDAHRREEMATHFVNAGEEYDIDPVLLVVWAFGESSLRSDAVGKLGEVGVFQVHGQSRNICERAGLELSKTRDQVHCGGLLFDLNRRYCGTIRAGLYRYASGSCHGTPRAIRITRRRLRQWTRSK